MPRIKKPLIVIVGETASGKTDLSINLAKIFGGEIIACDSRTIYKGMRIGTASPSDHDRAKVEHHLLNFIDPSKPISAADFKIMCKNEIDKINAKNKLPIMVGGSGLYIDSVIFDYDFNKNNDIKMRDNLKKLAVDQLQDIIIEKKLVPPKNILNQRHLISVINNNGNATNTKLIDDCLVIGLRVNRDTLKYRIEKRVNNMIENGLENETRLLVDKYGWNIEPMKSIGYREFQAYFDHKINITDLKQLLVKDTINYAKRQKTWFKRNKNIQWIDKQSEAVDLITSFLNK
ncbi:MAG: tRNA (adenosine(37)-N6)-dimethylallyltransferase MiaA [bacterium]